MYPLNSTTLLLAIVVTVCASSFELCELIKKIHEKSDSATVCFIGFEEDEALASLMRANNGSPVLVYTTAASETDELILYNVILVVKIPNYNEGYIRFLPMFWKRLRDRNYILITASNYEIMLRFFILLSENKFTRIFGIGGNISYAYMPFADNQVQGLDKRDPLPDALKDLNGFVVRTSLQRDIPRSFPYPDKLGRRKVGGCYGQVFVNFLRRHNATYKEISISNSTRLSIPNLINATVNNEIDVSMNVFTPSKGCEYSYPVKYVLWNIIVPINGYVDPNQYFIKPFAAMVWLYIGLISIYIIVMDVLKNICLRQPPNTWVSFSQTMNAMLNLGYERPVTSAYRFHLQVMLLAFVLGKIYNIYFTSFLTVFIRIKQYDTVQDLIDNNVMVMIPYYEWALISDKDLHPKGFEKIVASVDYTTYITEMNSMRNTSFAYGVGSDRGDFLIGLQTYFAKPLFHATRDGLVELHLGFLLPPHSPFTEILSNFVIDVMHTGLMLKWNSDEIVQGIQAGFKVEKASESPQKLPIPLSFNHLIFSWNCLVIGWITSSVVFVAERLIIVFRKS